MTAVSNLVIQSCSWDPELQVLGSFPAVLSCPAAPCPLVLVLTVVVIEGATTRNLYLCSSARMVEVSSQEYDGSFSYIDTHRGHAATVPAGTPPMWAITIALPYSLQRPVKQHSVTLQLKLLSIQPSKQQCIITQLEIDNSAVQGKPAAVAAGPNQADIGASQSLQYVASQYEANSTAGSGAAATGGGGGAADPAGDAGSAQQGANGGQASGASVLDSDGSMQLHTEGAQGTQLGANHEVESKGRDAMLPGAARADQQGMHQGPEAPALSQAAQLRLLLQHAAGDAATTASSLPASLQSLAAKLPPAAGGQGGKSLGGFTGMLQAVAKAAAQNALSAQQRTSTSDAGPTQSTSYAQPLLGSQLPVSLADQAGGTAAGVSVGAGYLTPQAVPHATGDPRTVDGRPASASSISIPAFGFGTGDIQNALQRLDTHMHRMNGVADKVDELLGCMQRVEQHLLQLDARMTAIEAAVLSRPDLKIDDAVT